MFQLIKTGVNQMKNELIVDEVLLAPDVAKLLKCSTRSLASMRDQLRPIRTGPKGRSVRYLRSEVDRYLTTCTAAAAAAAGDTAA